MPDRQRVILVSLPALALGNKLMSRDPARNRQHASIRNIATWRKQLLRHHPLARRHIRVRPGRRNWWCRGSPAGKPR